MNQRRSAKILSALKWMGIVLVSGFSYYFAARLGLKIATINIQASPIWPAAGLALCLVYQWGWRSAVGLVFGAALANYHVGTSTIASFFIGCGNAGAALATIMLFRGLTKNSYSGPHSRTIFSLFAIIICACISASVGTASLYFFDVAAKKILFENWVIWWSGDVIGTIFIIPLLFIFQHKDFVDFKKSLGKPFTILSLIIAVALTNYFVFQTIPGRPWLFALFIPLLYSALLLSTVWTYIFSVITAIFAIGSTVKGTGPFLGHLMNENLIHLQFFLLGLGATAAVLASLGSEGLPRRSQTALLFGWLLSGLTFFSFYNSNLEVSENRFELKVEQAESDLIAELDSYTELLHSGVHFFNASNFVTQDEWSSFTEDFLAKKGFKGFVELGVVFPTANLDLESFKKRYAEGNNFSDFRFQSVPLSSLEFKVAHPEVHLITTYIEPYWKNINLLGMNFSTERHHYEAAIKARDTGEPVVSNQIIFIRENQVRPGFIIFDAAYDLSKPHKSIAERRNSLKALVFTRVDLEVFIQQALAKFEDELHVKIFFPGVNNKLTLAYQSNNEPVDANSRISHMLFLADKPIWIEWQKTVGFDSPSNLIFSLMSFFGAVISLLLTLLLSSLENITRTAEKIADEKTKENLEKEQSWKSLTEVSPVGIYLTDANGGCTYVNSTWVGITGIPMNEALGQGWIKALHEEDRQRVLETCQKLIISGTYNCDFRFINQLTGQIFFVSARAVPIKNHLGKVNGFVGTVQDLTDVVRNQNALIASSRLSSLGEMASGVAHEINNPLAIILGRVSLIEQMIENNMVNSDKAKNYIKQISDTVHRISKIIKGLKSFGRETSLEPFEKCSVKNVLMETLEICKDRFAVHNIDLILPSQIDEKLYFWGRSEQIGQVLLNLLNNAFDAAHESDHSWVRVEVQGLHKKIFIRVSDSGFGISADVAKKMFEPFFTTKQIGKGTGLGLSISKGIIEKHYGRFYVDTNAKHTTFVIELDHYSLPSTTQPSSDNFRPADFN